VTLDGLGYRSPPTSAGEICAEIPFGPPHAIPPVVGDSVWRPPALSVIAVPCRLGRPGQRFPCEGTIFVVCGHHGSYPILVPPRGWFARGRAGKRCAFSRPAPSIPPRFPSTSARVFPSFAVPRGSNPGGANQGRPRNAEHTC